MPLRDANDFYSPLVTSDPHYIPGYTGYCPQQKEAVGATYGQSTNKLLSDSKVAGDGGLVANSYKERDCADLERYKQENQYVPQAYNYRSSSVGDEKYVQNMVPGYKGLVPLYCPIYGRTYARACDSAIGRFNDDQAKVRGEKAKLEATAVGPSGCEWNQKDLRPVMPLWSRQRDNYHGVMLYPGPYRGEPPYMYSESPYFMHNDDPRKYFVSGYMGFEPHTQSVIGRNHAVTTNRGLKSFANMQSKIGNRPLGGDFCPPVAVRRNADDKDDKAAGTSNSKMVVNTLEKTTSYYDPTNCPCLEKVYRYEKKLMPLMTTVYPDTLGREVRFRTNPGVIYRLDEGMNPTYAGHVPGQQFRFGDTFGSSSLNARELKNGGYRYDRLPKS